MSTHVTMRGPPDGTDNSMQYLHDAALLSVEQLPPSDESLSVIGIGKDTFICCTSALDAMLALQASDCAKAHLQTSGRPQSLRPCRCRELASQLYRKQIGNLPRGYIRAVLAQPAPLHCTCQLAAHGQGP